MTTHLTKVTCPTCATAYRIQLEATGEPYQLSCHVCNTVWAAESPKKSVSPPPKPVVTKASHNNVAPEEATPQPIQPPPPPQPPVQSWGPPPAYTAPPPPPFIPPQPLSPPRRVGATIGLLLLGTCFVMACVVGTLRYKEGKPIAWFTKAPVLPPQMIQTVNAELTIRDVRFDVQQTGKRQTILVVGMIDNQTPQAFTLHPLQVSVWGPPNQEGVSPSAPKDKNGECLLISWQHPFDVLHIESGQSRPFQTVGSLPAGLKISRVDVTLP